MTSVLRVKNEARSLPWVLPPLFRATQHVVVVDNQSDDGTPEVARAVAEQAGAADRLTVTEYPFAVSRCGAEHLGTPEDSVHNLAYFYNWSFAHVNTSYSMKWDGDMVLTAEGVETFADLAWQLENVEAVIAMPRHPLFVESDRVAYLDVYLTNVEEYVFPMGDDYRYVKAYEWELRMVPEGTRRRRLPQGLCVELKYLDSNEFDHWAGIDAFGATERTMRKQREWEVFHALRDGRYESPPRPSSGAPETQDGQLAGSGGRTFAAYLVASSWGSIAPSTSRCSGQRETSSPERALNFSKSSR
jgi:glycosyltransferase involved in cell wall biosynthesis